MPSFASDTTWNEAESELNGQNLSKGSQFWYNKLSSI
jgi:hypothetical protein